VRAPGLTLDLRASSLVALRAAIYESRSTILRLWRANCGISLSGESSFDRESFDEKGKPLAVGYGKFGPVYKASEPQPRLWRKENDYDLHETAFVTWIILPAGHHGRAT
jgi:hypothetical protein